MKVVSPAVAEARALTVKKQPLRITVSLVLSTPVALLQEIVLVPSEADAKNTSCRPAATEKASIPLKTMSEFCWEEAEATSMFRSSLWVSPPEDAYWSVMVPVPTAAPAVMVRLQPSRVTEKRVLEPVGSEQKTV